MEQQGELTGEGLAAAVVVFTSSKGPVFNQQPAGDSPGVLEDDLSRLLIYIHFNQL